MIGHNPELRLGVTAADETFAPTPNKSPALPSINWNLVGQQAPVLAKTPAGQLPKASAVVITWASAEWAAMEHVFCSGGTAMPYSDRSNGSWSGWQKFDQNLAANPPSGWSYWGYYRLIEIAGRTVLLFKSNTHLDFPGATYLQAMIKLIITQVKPNLILSIGTAGGAKIQDHVGTVRAVSAGTLDKSGVPPAQWPDYSNNWKAGQTTRNNPGFNKLLFPIPTSAGDLQSICSQFNQHYGTNYQLAQLDPNNLNLGDASPQIDDQTGGAESLLTTSSFVVGTTSGNYNQYACIEMDDAIIGETCKAAAVAFGFVRNVSDPVQNAALPPKVQGNWGSAIYSAYGFYTSYNGALVAWAMLVG
jgi:nucleoside phosphorylase